MLAHYVALGNGQKLGQIFSTEDAYTFETGPDAHNTPAQEALAKWLDDVQEEMILHFGLKAWLSEPQLVALMSFLIQKAPDFSVFEIMQAIMSAAAGELECDAEHYQSFNVPYLGRIISAFRKYRQKQLGACQAWYEVGQARALMAGADSGQEAYNEILKVVRSGRELPIGKYHLAWRYAEKNGLIRVSNKKRHKWAKKIRARLAMEECAGNSGVFAKTRAGAGRQVLADPKLFKDFCRIRLMKQHFINISYAVRQGNSACD